MKRNTLIVLLGLGLLAGGAGAPSASPSRIVLKDGRVIEGRLRAVQESRYLIDGREGRASVMLELPASQIASVDGSAALPAYDAQQPLQVTQVVDVVDPAGGATSWFTLETRNEGRELLTQVSWGVADWERERTARMQVRDAFGNTLTPRLMTQDGRTHVVIALAVPAAPRAPLALSVGYRDEAVARQDGAEWVYSFAGDYPEDRLVSRTLRLPVGATVVAVEPAPSFQAEHAGAPLIFWRRYYAAGERLPLTVRYRLP